MASGQQTSLHGSNTGDSRPQTSGVSPDPERDMREAAKDLKETARDRAEQGKQAAADQAEGLASAVNAAADRLGPQNETLAEYARRVGDGISGMADDLRNRSLDDFISDARELARRNPTLFLLGSIGVGVALSRFMKASGERRRGA